MLRRSFLVTALLLTIPACDLLPGRPATPASSFPGAEVVPGENGPAPTPRPAASPVPTPTPPPADPARGVPAGNAWLLHRGPATQLGNLDVAAKAYGLIALEADPEMARVTAAQIKQLQAGGATKVLGWLSLGVADASRPAWQRQAAAVANAALGPRAGRTGETWIDPDQRPIANVIVDQLAKAIAGAGVDGFLLGDVELAEHLQDAADGPCSASCRTGLLDLIQRLRTTYPDKLLVAYGATGDVLRFGTTTDRSGVPALLDGIVGEGTYAPAHDELGELELKAWKDMGLTVNGRPFFVGTAEAVDACEPTAVAAAAARARQAGFVPAIGTTLDAQRRPCAFE